MTIISVTLLVGYFYFMSFCQTYHLKMTVKFHTVIIPLIVTDILELRLLISTVLYHIFY